MEHVKKHKEGLPPGTVIFIGDEHVRRTRIELIDFNETELTIKEANIEECKPFKDRESTTWIRVIGLRDTSIIERIGKEFEFHPLILEDIAHTIQRPKIEDYDDYLFIVLRIFSYNQQNKELSSEQISIVITQGYIVTFQEKEGEIFQTLKNRIETSKGKIRKMGNDFLAYSLIDAIVDSYFTVLEKLNDEIEVVEDSVINTPTDTTLKEVHKIRGETITFHKAVWRLREVVSSLQRGDSKLIGQNIEVYFRDVQDHIIQLVDTIETMKDRLGYTLEMYLSSLSNRMNEVMKVLTIIGTIFIPLTFFAGVYGMNFKYFPEIEWKYGYLFFWVVIITSIGLTLTLYKKKGWI